MPSFHMLENMTAPAGSVGKLDVASDTYLRSLLVVNAHVILQVFFVPERALANGAHVWSFTRADALVILQGITPFERLRAQVTRKRALSGVGTAVAHLVA